MYRIMIENFEIDEVKILKSKELHDSRVSINLCTVSGDFCVVVTYYDDAPDIYKLERSDCEWMATLGGPEAWWDMSLSQLINYYVIGVDAGWYERVASRVRWGLDAPGSHEAPAGFPKPCVIMVTETGERAVQSAGFVPEDHGSIKTFPNWRAAKDARDAREKNAEKYAAGKYHFHVIPAE